MKPGLILILTLLLQFPIVAHSQKVNIPAAQPISLRTLFNSIEDQTEYTVFYNNKYLDTSDAVIISIEKSGLFEILDDALLPLNLEYKLRDKLIIIIPSESSQTNESDHISISGIILDGQGLSLPGATILVKGTSSGFTSDINGKFSVNTSPESVLVFSFIGKQTVEYTCSVSILSLVIVLPESPLILDEIVVTGVIANTQKKKLGFTVEKINEAQLQNMPSSNAAMVLNGKIPGIKISGNDAAPGSALNIQLRGATSIFGGSNPLFIIDGIISDENLIDINTEDIASIEVVKGAASSSLYGSRAANGVIHIITKRGNTLSNGTTKVVFRTEFGQSFLTYIPKKTRSINVEVEDGIVNYSKPTPDGIYNNPYPSLTDPVGSFFDPGFYNTNYLSFSSNSKDGKTSLYGSTQYAKENGVVNLVNGIDRINFRVNADHRVNDKIKITASSMYSQAEIDNRANNIWDLFYYADPDVDLMSNNEEDGSPYNVDPNKINTRLSNPLYKINNSIDNESRNRYLHHMGIVYRITNNIELKASYGIDKINSIRFSMVPKGLLQSGKDELTYGTIYKRSTNNLAQTAQIDGFFNKQIGHLTTKLKLQFQYESDKHDYHSGSGSHLAIRGLGVTSLEQASENINISSYNSVIVAKNISAVLYLDYKEKYIFDMLIREDGVSLFGANERWQTFYRFSSAWRITEDINIPGVQELKLRSSYGIAGLRPSFQAQYEVVGLNNGVITSPISMGNSDLRCSQSQEFETGFDARLLDKIDITFSYSKSFNNDQILEVPVSGVTGFSSQWQNAGKLESDILETSIGIDLINNGNLKWNMNLNWDRITQKVVELNRPGYAIISGGIFRIEEGVDFGTFYGRKFATSLAQVANQVPDNYTLEEYFVINNEGYVVFAESIGTVNEEPIQIKDNNGNFIEGVIGSVIPDFNMNLSSSLQYKNINFYCLLGYQQGGQTYNHMRRYMMIMGVGQSLDQMGKPHSSVKSIKYYEKLATWNNNHFVEDASFLKIREMSLSYDFEIQSLKNSLGISNINLGIISRNIFTFTKYSGFDPEAGVSDQGIDSNVLKYDLSTYPTFATLTGSLKISF